MAEGGEFGIDDPSLDHALDHDDDVAMTMTNKRSTEPNLFSQVWRPLPTTAAKK